MVLCLAPLHSWHKDAATWTNDSDICESAIDISTFFSAGTGVVQTTGFFDNTSATAGPNDPSPPCFAETGNDQVVNNSLWFTFTTNGGTFHIETVPCNAGSQYIDGGDTQMAIYQGSDCNNLVPVACNEDLYQDNDPNTDFRAGLDFQTVAGQTYFMMIDGYASGGVVATGLFCIEITRIATVTCEDANAGTFLLANNGYLCKGQNLLNYLTFDAASFVIPTGLPLSGMSWALTSAPIPANTWPGSIPGLISTPLHEQVVSVNLQNNITGSLPMVYYFTPVVVGGATLINVALEPKLQNLDISEGCFDVGAPQILTLVPVLQPLQGIATAVPASTGQNNGSVTLVISGGFPAAAGNPQLYDYQWNTGDTTPYLSNVGPGVYSVTVSDPSGCTDSITLTAGVTVPTKDPGTFVYLDINPNPGNGAVLLKLGLQHPAQVEIEILNPLGQVLQYFNAGNIQTLEQSLDLSHFSDGIYFVRVQADRQTKVQRLVIQH